jgi:hypothetical protein
MRHAALLFGGVALCEARYVDLWKRLTADSDERASQPCSARVRRFARSATRRSTSSTPCGPTSLPLFTDAAIT